MIQDLGIGGSTLRPRRVELRRMGLVKKTGATRLTAGKHQAAVWIACEEKPAVPTPKVALAMKPVLIKAQEAVTTHAKLNHRKMVPLWLPLSTIRDLVAALGESH
jgi:hypothetical protein